MWYKCFLHLLGIPPFYPPLQGVFLRAQKGNFWPLWGILVGPPKTIERSLEQLSSERCKEGGQATSSELWGGGAERGDRGYVR